MAVGHDRLAFLDSMRFLAASMVLLQHLFEHRAGFVGDYLVPLGPGVAGVAIFFFISGYVIPMAARGGFSAVPFFVRRVFRIYPLFFVALVSIALAGATGVLPQWGYMTSAPMHVWLGNLLLLQDFAGVRPFLGVSWTLAVELIWYALFAASLLVFGNRAADRLDMFVPVSLVVLAGLSLALDTRVPLGRPTMIYAAVIGFQCYRFNTGAIDRRRLARSLATFAVVALATNYVAFGIFSHPRITLAQALGPWTIGTIVFLTGVLWRPLREAGVLNGGVFPLLGAMSYSTYLLHPIAISAAKTHGPAAVQIPVALALTLILSWLGYRLVERPGIALGRHAARAITRPRLTKQSGQHPLGQE